MKKPLSKSAPFGQKSFKDDAYNNPAVLLSINDDLDLYYEKMIFDSQELKQNERKNEYRQMHLFQRLVKSTEADFLCKLTYNDSKSLGTYEGRPWERLLKLRDMWPQLGLSFSTKLFNDARLVFPSLNIAKPFFPQIPFPRSFRIYRDVTRERLSENLLEEYSYIESSCDRFTLHL